MKVRTRRRERAHLMKLAVYMRLFYSAMDQLRNLQP